MTKTGVHLLRARTVAGHTQDELSALTGIDKARLSRIENGFITPSEREVEILSRILNLRKNELFPQKEADNAD